MESCRRIFKITLKCTCAFMTLNFTLENRGRQVVEFSSGRPCSISKCDCLGISLVSPCVICGNAKCSRLSQYPKHVENVNDFHVARIYILEQS